MNYNDNIKLPCLGKTIFTNIIVLIEKVDKHFIYGKILQNKNNQCTLDSCEFLLNNVDFLPETKIEIKIIDN
jgi:hypothetical protein